MTRHSRASRASAERRRTSSRDAVHAEVDPDLESYVQRIVDQAPPLSAAQKDRLAVLLRPGATESRRVDREGGAGQEAEAR